MESRKAHQWLSVSFQFLSTVVTCSDLTMLTELTILKPPLQIGPISIFHLILSGFKFQMKEKILLLTSFANSAGTFNVEQRLASFNNGYILPKIVKCLQAQTFTFVNFSKIRLPFLKIYFVASVIII